jgi:hypothetical protein
MDQMDARLSDAVASTEARGWWQENYVPTVQEMEAGLVTN